MSAYITQLDILGFDGGTAAWTQKVNTVEEGGGGAAMSAACFTLSDYPLEDEFDRVSVSAFLDDQIIGHYDRKLRETWCVEQYGCSLTATQAYEGIYPDSVTFQITGAFEREREYMFTPVYLSLLLYDDQEVVLGSWEGGFDSGSWVGEWEGREDTFGFDLLFDSGSVVLPLIYPITQQVWDEGLEEWVEEPYQSSGLYRVVFSFNSSDPI